MTIVTTPAAARTDLTIPAAGREAANDAFVRRAGITLAAGALTWAASLVAVGAQPDTSLGVTISDLAAVPFQIGLFALVTAQLRTGATGLSRVARGMLKVEYVLLALATLWSVLHGAVPAFRDDTWLAVLDLFWPLSMLGMFVIAIKLVIAGRWRGVARGWPLVAESWAVVSVPAYGVLGPSVGDFVAAGHLLVGYLMLGVILALRPQLTRAEA
ncbi:hypothetical protein [Luedemannella helvata]|uniref:Uncharacterized protein n=1 Tax=Luedemannella helvata TaxID=349315 RepID=A0ABP4W5V4_9ACTN